MAFANTTGCIRFYCLATCGGTAACNCGNASITSAVTSASIQVSNTGSTPAFGHGPSRKERVKELRKARKAQQSDFIRGLDLKARGRRR
jgi:hypothetical protein